MLASRQMMSQKEAPIFARFRVEPPRALDELELYEVGKCCERYARAELSHLKESLLVLAAAPDTEQAWLVALWNLYQREAAFQEALIKNPNLPRSITALLAPLYFDTLLENPALALWCLESPDFLQELERFFLKRIAAQVEVQWRFPCAVSWLQRLSESPNVEARCYVASHQETPKELCWKLASDPNPAVRGYLAYHADEELLLCLARDPETDVRREAARVGVHLRVLALLACDPAYEVRAAVGFNQRVTLPSKMRILLREEHNTSAKYFR